MKLIDALNIIDNHNRGYMIHFEKREANVLVSDYFPDQHAGETLIESEEQAWELAEKFAKATIESGVVNVYVVDHHYRPVAGYDSRRFN